ncbi:MAG: hypothetical protein ACYSR1_07050, partial [Planctomycetota bacterium]
KKSVVKAKLQKAEEEIKRSKANISKQGGAIKRAKFNLNIYGNYIDVAKKNIRKLAIEKESEEDVVALGRKHDREAEYAKNVSLIKKIIEKDKRRIKSTKRKILVSQRLIDEENKKIEKATLEIEKLNRSNRAFSTCRANCSGRKTENET